MPDIQKFRAVKALAAYPAAVLRHKYIGVIIRHGRIRRNRYKVPPLIGHAARFLQKLPFCCLKRFLRRFPVLRFALCFYSASGKLRRDLPYAVPELPYDKISAIFILCRDHHIAAPAVIIKRFRDDSIRKPVGHAPEIYPLILYDMFSPYRFPSKPFVIHILYLLIRTL